MRECEHTRILRALIEHPQGILEGIKQKPCRAPKMNLGGRSYRKNRTYATGRTRAYSTKRYTVVELCYMTQAYAA